MSDYCMLSSQTFYGLLFSSLTITDVTSSVDHTVHLTKIITVNSFTNAHKKITLARFACLCFQRARQVAIQLNQSQVLFGFALMKDTVTLLERASRCKSFFDKESRYCRLNKSHLYQDIGIVECEARNIQGEYS